MNYIDIIIAVVLVVFGIAGLRKGIISEVATLLGLVLGLFGAFKFSDFTAEKVVQYISIDPKYLNTVAFVLTFIVVAVLVNLLGRLMAKLVQAINLGFIDKIGGFVVGVAKGLLICSLAVMLLNSLTEKGIVSPDIKEGSMLYPMVEKTVPYLYDGYDLVKEAVKNVSLGDDVNGALHDAAADAPSDH